MGDIKHLESRRLTAQKKFDQAQDNDQRNRQGQFATPPALANDIVSAVLNELDPSELRAIRFLEPSIGSGAFFSALLHASENLPGIEIISANGVDVDAQLLDIANEIWSKRGLVCMHGSVFEISGLDRISNLIITNPPYSRHHHLSQEMKAELKQQLLSSTGVEISGLAGLHCYIMASAHKWLEEGGVSAWLVPQEILDVGYGKELKRILFQEHNIIRIHSFGNKNSLFDDASVTSIVVLLRKKTTPSRENQSIRFTVGSMANPTEQHQVDVEIDDCDSRWSPVFADGNFGNSEIENGKPLSDYLTAKRGVATGNNSFFIKTLREWKARGIDEAFLTPIMPPPRNFSETVLSSEFSGSEEFPMLLSVDANSIESVNSSEVASYLQRGLDDGVADGYLCKKRDVWFKQESREAPDFFLTYIGRKSKKNQQMFRFIRNDGNAICSNNYIMLYLKNKGDKDMMWDWLRSLTDMELHRCAREYGDGMRKLEPSEVLNLRIGV